MKKTLHNTQKLEEPTEYWDIIREMILLANAHQKIVQ
jgi:hypothetical protein